MNPDDYWVISKSDPNLATLTLITCTPKATSKQRLVVFAELDPTRSGPVGQATVPQLTEQAATRLPDEPAVSSTAPATTRPPVTMAAPLADRSVGAEIAATTATTAATVQGTDLSQDGSTFITATTMAPVVAPVEGEAFSGTWFDDTDAWPHIAGWGMLLSIIATGAYLLSRKTRHDSIGFLAGVVPFTVSLHFFFENVNRLLPPGL